MQWQFDHIRYNCSRMFRKPVKILDDLAFAFREGESVAIIGPSGSGKSTLAGVLCGKLTPQFGTVQGVHHASTLRIRKQWGYVPEVPYFPRNVGVISVLKSERVPLKDKVIDSLLLKYGLSEEGKKPLEQWSWGKRKMLSWLIALESPTRVIIADDPFGFLDDWQTMAIRALIRQKSDAASRCSFVFLDSHIPVKRESVTKMDDAEEGPSKSVVSFVDRVYFLDSGKIIRSADVTELMAHVTSQHVLAPSRQGASGRELSISAIDLGVVSDVGPKPYCNGYRLTISTMSEAVLETLQRSLGLPPWLKCQRERALLRIFFAKQFEASQWATAMASSGYVIISLEPTYIEDAWLGEARPQSKPEVMPEVNPDDKSEHSSRSEPRRHVQKIGESRHQDPTFQVSL